MPGRALEDPCCPRGAAGAGSAAGPRRGGCGHRAGIPPSARKAGHAGPGIWLPVAAAGLCVLSGAAAAVSYAAQYRLVFAARHLAVAALLEADLPRAFRTAYLRLIYAVDCRSTYSSWACRGLRY